MVLKAPTRTATLVAMLVALAAMFAAMFASTASAAVANPDLAPACGTKVILVLDESGSISTTPGAETAVRTAANAFATGLADTGSQLAVIEFGSAAKRVFGYTNVTSGAAGTLATTFQPYFNGTAAAPADVYDSPSQLGQWTNWEDALEEVKLLNTQSGVAPLVVFITDGDPTAINVPGGVQTNVANATALTPAVVQADAVKTQGSHILAVGVGASLNNATSLGRLQAISGNDVATSADQINIGTTDVLQITDFSSLPAALSSVVTALCQSSVTINKQVDDGAGYVPGGAGWTFGAAVTPASGTYTWLTPNPGAAGPRSAATGADSAVTFQWKPSSATTSTATFTETEKLGYQFVSATCTVKTGANGASTPLAVTQNGTGFTVTLGSTQIASCIVKNKKMNPAIAITKVVDKPTVLAGTLVTYTIKVTNTGDVALNNVAVADAIAPNCAKAVGNLAVGASNQYTCTATITQDTTNTATATAKDPQGTAVPPKQASATVDVIAPAISITKSVDKPTVISGTQVTWTVNVTNTGDVTLTNVAVTDPTAPGCATVIGSLAPGASAAAITCTSTITTGTTNTATVTGKDPLGNTLTKDASATVGVIAPAISITKSVDKPTVISGTQVTWTVNVTNTGDVDLTDVAVSDPTAPGCATVIGSLAAGASVPAITCTSTITTGTTNTATVTGKDPLGNTLTKDASATVNVIAPGLSITKTVDDSLVTSGTTVTWTITVTNTGDVTLSNVTIGDAVAPGCDTVIPTLAAGATSAPITCTSTVTADVTNVATASGTDPLGNTVGPVTASASVDVVALGLEITKVVDKPVVQAGGTVTWTVTVKNTSDLPLNTVTVTDPVAPGCATVIAVLAPGEVSAPITCTSVVNGPLTNTATAVGTVGAPGAQPGGPQSPIGTTVGPVSASASVRAIKPAIGIVKTVDKPSVPAGTAVTFTITVTNTGDSPLSNVVVSDQITPACNRNIGPMAAGAVVSYTCSATITQTITNVAIVTGTDELGGPVTGQSSATVTADPGIIGETQTTLRIDKRGPATAKSGAVITYTIKVTNTGTVTATNVVIRDKVPTSMSLAKKTPGVTLVKGQVVINIGDLAPGASKTVKVKFRIDRSASGTRTNTATASATNARTVKDSAKTRIVQVGGRIIIPGVTG